MLDEDRDLYPISNLNNAWNVIKTNNSLHYKNARPFGRSARKK